jgi:threonine dehydratase
VVISSSGNAAIATSAFAQLHALPAIVCVHPATDPDKLASIDGRATLLVVTERAINSAKLIARSLGIANLRPSVDDDAVTGYASLGDELAQELPAGIDSVVMFATSGATAIAVAQVLHVKRPEVAVHVVQGEGNAALVDSDAQVTDATAHGAAAGRLGVRRSRRARQLRRAMELTGGRGHVATSSDVKQARALLATHGIVVSDESAANVAIAQQLADSGERVCCIISGAPVGASDVAAARVNAADEHEALVLVNEWLAAR